MTGLAKKKTLKKYFYDIPSSLAGLYIKERKCNKKKEIFCLGPKWVFWCYLVWGNVLKMSV